MSEDHVGRHPIRVVCRRTGLKADLLRAWERRYGVVDPARTETDRRLYSDADIERLQLLQRAVAGGRSIGQIAQLDREQLVGLLEDEETSVARPVDAGAATGALGHHYDRCLEAIRRFEAAALTRQFELAAMDLSRRQLLEELLVPLLGEVGGLWRSGALSPAQEHLFTSVVRTFLGSLAESFRPPGRAQRLLVTTPAGQVHELGALLAATTAASQGWAVTYLGPNLPAADIALAAMTVRARAVALSLTYPDDDPMVIAELSELRRLLGHATAVLVGGRAAPAYQLALDEIGAIQIPDLARLRRELSRLGAPE